MRETLKDLIDFVKEQLNGLFTIFIAAIIVVAGVMAYVFFVASK